ncbi:MAG: ComEC/Rec2 family competence protein [Pirellulales bacterium]
MDAKQQGARGRAPGTRISRVPGRQGVKGALSPLPAPRSLLVSPSYQPLVTVLFSVAAGIVLDRYSPATEQTTWFAVWWCLAVCSLAVWWWAWRRRRDTLAAWPLLAAAAFAAASWHDARWHLFERHELARYADYEPAPACIFAVAREMPERVPAPEPSPLRAIPGSERSRLTIDVVSIRDGKTSRPAAGRCQLAVEGHLLGVRPGDRLRVFGQLAAPSPPLNPGEFDFAAHGRADRQLTRVRSSAPECVSVIHRSSGRGPANFLEAVRVAGKRIVRSYVGPDRAGLANAVLLGAREALRAEETLPYLLTGTIHVLVVSGLNVAILAAGLFFLIQLGVVSRRAGLALIMLVVVAYAIVAESQPPVVRAAVFAVLVCIAAWNGRPIAPFNTLAATGLVVLAINPGDLFRPGPQLSFLAVATLIWIGNRGGLIPSGPSDWVERMFAADQPWYVHSLVRWGRNVGWLGGPPDRLEQMIAAARPRYVRSLIWCGGTVRWLVYASLVVALTTLPLVLHRFHVGSPIAVLISPVVWVVVFVAMWSGFVLLSIGWLIPPVAVGCGAVCNLSLAGLDGLVQWADSVPAGHFWAAGPAWWWVLGFYLGLMLVMVRGRTLAPRRWHVAVLCAWIVVGIVPSLARTWSRDALECSFVAVGHGACVVLEAPTGETVVYDAGALGAPEYATQTIASYLWHRGIRRIDGLVISHADVDHYNAVPGLLERFRVGAVYVSPMMFDVVGETGGGPEVLRNAIRTAGVPIREIWSGDRLRVGSDLTVHVLHPPRLGVVGTDNANSITLAVEFQGRRFLLPGDLESPGLEDVMAELPYDCDVLLAPHHGSRRSDPPGFAAWSTPEWVVISGGGSDEVGPVVQTYEDSGAYVMRTSERGVVRFSMGPGGLKMASWRPPR